MAPMATRTRPVPIVMPCVYPSPLGSETPSDLDSARGVLGAAANRATAETRRDARHHGHLPLFGLPEPGRGVLLVAEARGPEALVAAADGTARGVQLRVHVGAAADLPAHEALARGDPGAPGR